MLVLLLYACFALADRVVDHFPHNRFMPTTLERHFVLACLAFLILLALGLPLALLVNLIDGPLPIRSCALEPQFSLLLGFAIAAFLRRWWLQVIARVLLKMNTWKPGKNDP